MLPRPPSLRASRRLRLPARPASRITGARRALIGGGLAVVAVALLLGGAALVLRGSVDYALLSAAGAACLLVLLAVPALKPDYDVVEPLSFVLLAVAVGVTLKPAYILFGPEANADYLLLNRQEPAFLVTAIVFMLVGLGSLCAGYLLPLSGLRLGRSRLLGWPVWSRPKLLLVSALGIVVALAAMYLYVDRLGVTGILQDFSRKRFLTVEGAEYGRSALGYYRWAASVTAPIFLFFFAWALGKQGKIGAVEVVVLGGLLLLSVVFPFFNSSRTKVLIVLIEALVVWKCVRGRIPRWATYGIGVGMLALLVLLSLVRNRSADLSSFDSRTGVQTLLESTVGGRHFLDLTKTAHIIEGVPEKVDYMYGETYVSWAFMPIPRTVWLDKPPLGAGPIIGSEIFDLRSAGVPPGMIAEAYLNFGVLGILFVPFLLGAGMRWCYESFRPVLANPAGAAAYATAVIPIGLTTVTSGFSQMVIVLLISVAPVLVVAALVRARRPRAHAL